jgi:GNAT superfamily N-acetyltransferase
LFETIPERLHKSDPYFVPPFPGSIVKLFGAKAPFQRHGEMVPLIALKDGQAVGRIAAIVHRSHNEFHHDQVGFFGFFDCIDDADVATALLDRAKSELKKRGLNVVRGPYNPTSNDDFGLLTEGFDSSPFVMMPYNPSYYVGLYDKIGLKSVKNFFAFYIASSKQPPERIAKIVERVKRSTGITIRNIDMSRLGEELKIIKELYNVTLDRNWGFVPITMEDLEFAAEDLKAIVDPSMVLIAEKDGKAAGYSMTIPNINELLWKVRKLPPLLRIIKFVFLLKTKHPREARLAALGIAPEFRNKGIPAVFYYETLIRGKRNYVGGELSWVEENNVEIMKSIEVMGGEKYKTYRIYEQSI